MGYTSQVLEQGENTFLVVKYAFRLLKKRALFNGFGKRRQGPSKVFENGGNGIIRMRSPLKTTEDPAFLQNLRGRLGAFLSS